MSQPNSEKSAEIWGDERVSPGSARDIHLAVSESYSGITLRIPLHIRRAAEDGPVVFLTAALHGDEINGTGAIRQLLSDPEFVLLRGSVICVPVLNLLSFERHSRYLPDRRDLNRSFPGLENGTQASRLAHKVFQEIVLRSDYGIDLHTAAVRRTNYPTVRADLTDPEVTRIAKAFGCELMLNGSGPKGALRREACQAGCPTIVMEGGEVWKVEPAIVKSALRGIKNVLRELKMLEGDVEKPNYQVAVDKTKWVRADRGGFLQFHIQAGDIVDKGQILATNTDLLGHDLGTLEAPFNGVVIGMTTLPSVSPGEPVFNLARLPKGTRPHLLREQRRIGDSLERQLTQDLGSNILVIEPPASP